MNPSSFTNSEFARLKEDQQRLIALNAELRKELKVWKPEISFDAGMDKGQPAVVYTCRYGDDGFRKVLTGVELASAPPEVLDAICTGMSKQSAEVRSKKIADLIRPFMQKAANYAHTAGKK